MKKETKVMLQNEICSFFTERGEYYGAGYFEEPHKSPFERFSRALRRYFENYRLPEYKGEPLYPCGGKWKTALVNPDFSFTVAVNWNRLAEQSQEVRNVLGNDFDLYTSRVTPVHTVGGNMYTHSYPNFKRIVYEGLDSYEKRIEKISLSCTTNIHWQDAAPQHICNFTCIEEFPQCIDNDLTRRTAGRDN